MTSNTEQESSANSLDELKKYYKVFLKNSVEETGSSADLNKMLDDEAFDPEQFVDVLFQTSTLPEIIKLDAVFTKQINALQTKLKGFVYENYSKFVSSKKALEDMYTDSDQIKHKLHQIQTSLKRISDACDEKPNLPSV